MCDIHFRAWPHGFTGNGRADSQASRAFLVDSSAKDRADVFNAFRDICPNEVSGSKLDSTAVTRLPDLEVIRVLPETQDTSAVDEILLSNITLELSVVAC